MFLGLAIDGLVNLELKDVYLSLKQVEHHADTPDTELMSELMAFRLSTRQPHQISSLDDIACSFTPLG